MSPTSRLHSTWINGELKIELTEDDFDDLEVHWTIEMPAVATTEPESGGGPADCPGGCH